MKNCLSIPKKNFLIFSLLGCFFLISLSVYGEEVDSSLEGDVAKIGESSWFPQFVAVGDAGNAADPRTGCGAVSEAFLIAENDVTVQQWCVFLNSVKVIADNKWDPRGLYHQEMFQAEDSFSSIMSVNTVRKLDKSYDQNDDEHVTFYLPVLVDPTYFFFSSRVLFPITKISLDDAKRYCNWLQHGHPYLSKLDQETLAVTETGAYDFTNGKKGELMEGAVCFLPTCDQWYKVAYYKGGSLNAGYWQYPLQANRLPRPISLPTERERGCENQFEKNIFDSWKMPEEGLWQGANVATASNSFFDFYQKEFYTREVPYLTPVGFFKDSPSYYGACDMGGNVRQWIDLSSKVGSKAMALGGSWNETSDALLSSHNIPLAENFFNVSGNECIGFRVGAKVEILQKDIMSGDGAASLSSDLDPNQEQLLRQLVKDITTSKEATLLGQELFWTLFLSSVGISVCVETGATILEIIIGQIGQKTWAQIWASMTWNRLLVNVLFVGTTGYLNTLNATNHLQDVTY